APVPPAVAPSRVPANGGATAPASQAGATPAPRVKPAAQTGATAHPVRRAGPPAAKRRVTSITERVRPSTTPDLEAEMLQRFERLRAQDLYEVLGIALAATGTEIRRAYYALAKRFHPDKFTREGIKTKAEKVFAHITEAYSTLTGEESRRRYDEDQAI